MNNVNMQDIEKYVSTIEKDPAHAKKNKRVTGSWVFKEGKPQFISTVEYPKGKVVLKTELPSFAVAGEIVRIQSSTAFTALLHA